MHGHIRFHIGVVRLSRLLVMFRWCFLFASFLHLHFNSWVCCFDSSGTPFSVLCHLVISAWTAGCPRVGPGRGHLRLSRSATPVASRIHDYLFLCLGCSPCTMAIGLGRRCAQVGKRPGTVAKGRQKCARTYK